MYVIKCSICIIRSIRIVCTLEINIADYHLYYRCDVAVRSATPGDIPQVATLADAWTYDI